MKISLKTLFKPWNLFLGGILVLAFFVRVYRQGDLLGFYYDQGRDALVIWKLWHEGRPFLIGPVTGLAGIFLGPFYYYLIAPFYLIGGGNPLYPAFFLAFLATAAVGLLYFLGAKMHSKTAGIFAAIIGAFSYNLVYNSRWLSNPVPVYLTSLLFLWSLWEIISGGKKYWWILASLFAGISMHFQSASAIFYVPILLLFSIWQRKRLPSFSTLALSLGAFVATLAPQIVFNFRHDNIILNNFSKLFFEQKGFSVFTKFLLEERTKFFWEVTTNKLLSGWYSFSAIFFFLVLSALGFARKNLKNPVLPLFLIFFVVPIIGYYSFRGNNAVLYDYYLSGYYLPFILIFSIGLAELAKSKMGSLAVSIFFLIFLVRNLTIVHSFLTQSGDGPQTVNFKNQLKAVTWVFEDARGRGEFNTDFYVPPVIPYAYEYLFLWQGTARCGQNLCGMGNDKLQPTLYTLYEEDPPHPERLEAWLKRQKGIGEVEEETSFAGITVQRRKRL
jgi:4-amino-4-deoxy-L-arabinose transferase-like glycosyltransferase